MPQGGGQGICLSANLHLDVISRNQLFGGSCPAKDGNWICHFGLRVTNIGEQLFEGGIQIADALPIGTPAGAAMTFEETPGWDCGGPAISSNLYQCRTTNAKLGKGESVLIRGAIKVPFAPVEKCTITNNGKIVGPQGSQLNTLKSDNSDTVAMPLQKDVVLPNGQVACSSKQSNLKLEKTAWVLNNNYCQVSGNIWVCDWKLKLTNTGPDDFASPVEFVDELVGPFHLALLSRSVSRRDGLAKIRRRRVRNAEAKIPTLGPASRSNSRQPSGFPLDLLRNARSKTTHTSPLRRPSHLSTSSGWTIPVHLR